MMRQLVVNPDAFMKQRAGQPNIRRELLVVLVIGSLGALGLVGVAQQTREIIGDSTANLPLVGLVITPIVGAFVLWAFYAITLHIIANRIGGDRQLRRLLKLTAWALIPIGIGNLARTAAAYFAFQELEVQTVMESTAGRLDPVSAIMNAVRGDPLYLIGTLILLATIAWTGYLLVYALQNGKGIPRDRAIRAVLVPVGIHVLFVLWQLVDVLG